MAPYLDGENSDDFDTSLIICPNFAIQNFAIQNFLPATIYM